MMIFDGFQLNGRKPRHTPTAMIATSGRDVARRRGSPALNNRSANRNSAPPAIATMPAARPSRPSMRLIAFVINTTHSAVTSGAQVGRRARPTSVWNRLNGIRKKNIVTPNSASRLAASTWPATLAGGDTSMRSSSAPMTNITPAPSIRPNGSELSLEHLVELVHVRRDGHRGEEADEHRRAAERRRRAWCARGARSSDGATTAPKRIASSRTTGVSEQRRAERDREDDRVARHGHASRGQRFRVRRELRAEAVGLLADLGRDAVVVDVRAARVPISDAISRISSGPMPAVVHDGGAEPQPARDERLLGVVRDRVLVARDPGAVERLLRDLAGDAERPEVDEHQVVVGAARHDAEALVGERRRRARCALVTTSAAYCRNAGCARLVERDRLRRDHVHERAALQTRGTPPCRSRPRTRCAAQDRARARAAQRLVRRERDDVGVRHRRRVRAAGDRARRCARRRRAAARRPRRRSRGTPRSR